MTYGCHIGVDPQLPTEEAPHHPILLYSLLFTLLRALSQASVSGMNVEGLGTLICLLVPVLCSRLLSFRKAGGDCSICLDGQRAGGLGQIWPW